MDIKDKIERVKVADLKYFPDNPRKHSKKQIKQLSDQIKIVGFNQPLIIDELNQVLVGNGRLEAAEFLGMTELPVIKYTDLTLEQKKQLIVADNKLNDNSEWNIEILGDWLNDLTEANLDHYFDPEEMTKIWESLEPSKQPEKTEVQSHERQKDKKNLIISELNKVINTLELSGNHGEEVRIIESAIEYISNK